MSPVTTAVATQYAPTMGAVVASVARRSVRSKGPAVCRWIEANCIFTKGRWEGLPFRLQAWERDLINELFELVPTPPEIRALTRREYRRRYRRALVGGPKKNGKTEGAAGGAPCPPCGG